MNDRPLYDSMDFLLAVIAFLSITLFAGSAMGARYVDLKVLKGDTLKEICRRHLEEPTRCREIYQLNRLSNPDLIHPGQHLKIPVELLSGVPQDAVVTFVKGDVLVIPREGGAGRRPVADEVLKEGERIETGEDGIIELTFADETTLLVRGNSSVSVVRSRDKGGISSLRELYLKAGRVLSRIRKATGQERRYIIRTPATVAGARGTEFRVSAQKEGVTRTEVLEGTVAVEGGGHRVTLGEGEGTLAGVGEPPIPPVPLLPPPQPVDLPPVFRSSPMSMRFETIPQAVSLHVMLSRDPSMKDLIRDEIIPATSPFLIPEMDDGEYHLQTTAIDRHGLEGIPAVPVPVKVRMNPRPPVIQSPADGSELRGGSAELVWLRVKDAVEYRLQVASDPTFASPLLDETIRGATEHRLKGLAVGDYRFRLASVAQDGYQGEWTDPVGFRVVPPPPAPVAENPETGGDKVRLRVRSAGSGYTYHFQVARDEGFTTLLHDVRQDAPELVIPRPGESGVYYVRTSAIDPSGYEGGFSPPQSFEVPRSFPYGLFGVLGGALGLILFLAL